MRKFFLLFIGTVSLSTHTMQHKEKKWIHYYPETNAIIAYYYYHCKYDEYIYAYFVTKDLKTRTFTQQGLRNPYQEHNLKKIEFPHDFIIKNMEKEIDQYEILLRIKGEIQVQTSV